MNSAAWRGGVSRADLQELLRIDDRRAWLSVIVDWAIVAACFALVARWPNPLTVLVALVLIGGRQLGISVLMHEAAHRTLFSDRRVNDWVGNWLCGYPVLSTLVFYRPVHLQHHAKTWTDEDPDLNLATPFPVTQSSFRRKVWRDLSGQTGVKRLRGYVRALWRQGPVGRRALRGSAITNLVLLGVLTLAGHPALYLLWLGAWLTTYSLIMRLRSIAEHSMVSDPRDALQNTRTMEVSWLERLLVAPNCVNYHLEHHLLMTIPHYNLPRLHAMLRRDGVLDGANVVRGYARLWRMASSRAAA